MLVFAELLLQSRERCLRSSKSNFVFTQFYQQLKIHFSSRCFSFPVFSEQLLIFFFFAVSESKSLEAEFIIKALYQKLIQHNFTETLILNAIKLLVDKTDCISFFLDLHIYSTLWRFLLLLLIAFRNLVRRSGRSCCNL